MQQISIVQNVNCFKISVSHVKYSCQQLSKCQLSVSTLYLLCMPEILSQSSAEVWYALEALKSNFILVCCCFHLRRAKNVLFIPSKCLLKAYSINEGLSVVEMKFFMPVHMMELCATSRTP